QHIYASPAHVAASALWLDVLLIIPGYAAAMALLLVRGRSVLRSGPATRIHRAHGDTYKAIAAFGLAALGAGVVADLLEDAGSAEALRTFWPCGHHLVGGVLRLGCGDDVGSGLARFLIRWSGLFTATKAAGIGLALASL